MHEHLQHQAEEFILSLINQCTPSQQTLFKRLYSAENLSAPLEEVVNGIDPDDYTMAIGQLERTLKSNVKTQQD